MRLGIFIFIWCVTFCQGADLAYQQAPIDNPLKGLTTITGILTTPPAQYTNTMPTSVRYGYLALRNFMTGPTNFTWTNLDAWLDGMATNTGCQGIPKFYLDYPRGINETNTDFLGTNSAIPQYLLDGGLSVSNYTDYGNYWSLMPNYEDVNLRTALTNFITAFGANFDGDPRIAFIQVGLLGFWGEWHCNQHFDWAPSLAVQNEIYTAFTNAFKLTKLQLRYAAGTNNDCSGDSILRNDNLPFGYLDDSFCGKTLGTNCSTMEQQLWIAGTGAQNKWKTQPFGGEVRSELQTHCWDDPPYEWAEPNVACAGYNPFNQISFDDCVRQMHATWMGNWFANSHVMNVDGYWTRSQVSARLLGYELYAKSWTSTVANEPLCTVTMTNTGVAPFYYDWQMQVAAATNGAIAKTWNTSWKLTDVVPGDGDVNWNVTLTNPPSGTFTLLMRAVNPMANGKVLRFANATQHSTITNWLTLGDVTAGQAKNLRGKHGISGKFKLE